MEDDGSLEHFVYEDPIMCTEEPVGSLVEAQFTAGGEWVLSRATLSGLQGEKDTLFKLYEKGIKAENPDCLSTLRRMLQTGPITNL